MTATVMTAVKYGSKKWVLRKAQENSLNVRVTSGKHGPHVSRLFENGTHKYRHFGHVKLRPVNAHAHVWSVVENVQSVPD